MMPVLFIGHGSPMNAIENNEFSEGWRNMADSLPRPKAILCISAHWETSGTFVTAMERPRTIHDFGGFPKELYEVQYPAPGSPALADETINMTSKTAILPDQHWGLDHGSWSVIRNMYPEADIPVIQVSLDYRKNPKDHYDLAGELLPFRNKGILIIGSGNMVHNLGMVSWKRLNETFAFDWAQSASDKMKQFIDEGDHTSLINYRKLGKEFELSVPTPEHFLPLLYTIALRGSNEKITFFNDKPVAGSLTMTSIKIGE